MKTLYFHQTPYVSPMADKVSVINPFYCAPYSITLQINTEKGVTYNENGDRLFYMDDSFFTLHNRRVLYDDTQKPIVTFYKKVCFLMYTHTQFYYLFHYFLFLINFHYAGCDVA